MSLKKYLICIDYLELKECEVAIVLVDNKENAIEKYISNISIKNEFFLENVYSPYVNMSYAETLFRDDRDWYNLYISIFEYEDEKDED